MTGRDPVLVLVLVLKVPLADVEAELGAARHKLAAAPEGWSAAARMGRLPRYAGDPAGLELLRTAADTQLAVHAGSAQSLLNDAVLLRLSGNRPGSDGILIRLVERFTADEDAVDLLEVCVLLGLDDEALRVVDGPLAGNDDRLRQRAVGLLARGRRGRDVRQCDAAVQRFDEVIAAEHRSLTGTTVGMTPHDWLETALVIRSAVTGTVSDRLRRV